MENIAISLMTQALRTAALIAMPAVIAVALVGVIVGILQTLVQVQDQNVAFAPKLGTIALLVSFAGPAAFALLETLLVGAIQALPEIARV
ncbi:MAG: flagellar biosynthetic protein FliQ [Candidatus Eremiobacterales bacterium]